MRARLLITGFGPFGIHADNPSARIAEAVDGITLHGFQVVGRTLDVSWSRAWPTLVSLIDEWSPIGVVCFGVAPEPFFRFEVAARNCDLDIKDVDGQPPRVDPFCRCVPDGPPGYWTGLPVEWLAERLRERAAEQKGRASGQLSTDAGGYLCNHVFYRLMHSYPAIPMRGFVHVPRAANPDESGRPRLREVVAAGRFLVKLLAEFSRAGLPGHTPRRGPTPRGPRAGRGR